MKVIWKAACAAVLLIAATSIEIGCGGTFRPVANPTPVTTANPASVETEVVLNECPPGSACPNGSVLTDIDSSGDSNAGNKVLLNTPTSIAFDSNRGTVYAANTAADSLTQVTLLNITGSFAATTNTITLEPGASPIGMTFEYFGIPSTTDYVVNSGKNPVTGVVTGTPTCPNLGSISAITQATAVVKGSVCVGASPVFGWIFRDQSKVFVLDKGEDKIYVVNAAKLTVTNHILLPVGSAPIKAAQSADGNFLYVLNSGTASISVIDAQQELVLTTVATSSTSPSPAPVDIAQHPSPTDTTADAQANRVWVLNTDGSVSVYDTTAPGSLNFITSIPTITTAQLNAGVKPTNLAMKRDGTGAYVGLLSTDQIVAIDTSKLSTSPVTTGATTSITVGVHRSISQSLTDTAGVAHIVPVETTTPTVTFVVVSRGGSSSDTNKAYAATTTETTYSYYDANVNPAPPPSIAPGCTLTTDGHGQTCPSLYSGTTVVTAIGDATTPLNTVITTIASPSVVVHCDPGIPLLPTDYDLQKACPAMQPTLVLGSS
jgi:hypothetical protein